MPSTSAHISLSERVYVVLLYLLPRTFRARFAYDMRECFRDLYVSAKLNHGRRGVFDHWSRQLPDLFATIVREYGISIRDLFRNLIRTPSSHVQKLAPPLAHSKGDSMLETVMQDTRFAARTLRKSPFFTAIVVTVVALGIGSVATVFSAANSIVLRPIPGVQRPGNLIEISRTGENGRSSLSPSYPYYKAMRERTKSLSGLAAWTMVPLTVSDSGDGISALGNLVSANYFDVLGVRPLIGRFFRPSEDIAPGSAPVVVLSHGFWQRRFAGDSSVVGRVIHVNGHQFTVIGIAPSEFRGIWPIVRSEVWVPMMMQAQVRGSESLDKAGSGWLTLFGRIAPASTRERAQAELNLLTKQWATDGGNEPKFMQQFIAVKMNALTALPSDGHTAALAFAALLLAVSGLVLLIASSNVAGMLLARAVVRRREIAVRLALGAGRWRLVRQLMTESLVLYFMGAAVGIALAWWGCAVLSRTEIAVGIEVPITVDVTPDLRVLLFALASALVAGVLFGLAPALQASRSDVSSTLRADTAGGGGPRSRLRNILVTSQIAMSLLLLMSAGLFLRALQRGKQVDPGFAVDHIATAPIELEAAGYDDIKGRALFASLRERIEADPGVVAVTYSRMLPLTMSSSGTDLKVDGYVPPAGREGDNETVAFAMVDANYFGVVQMPVLSGRPIDKTDHQHAQRSAVVNEEFVKHYWKGVNPVGRTIHMDDSLITVVGVVRNAKYSKLDEELRPFVYLPLSQHWQRSANIMIRTKNDPMLVAPAVRAAMKALDKKLPVPTLVSLERATAVVLLPQRIAAGVSAALGSIGLVLAAVGLYGMIAFAVNQRTREIGIRIALGARQSDVIRLIVREGMRFTIVGVVIGMALAAVGTQLMRPFLFGVSPLDPLTFVAIPASLALVAFVASYIPARRAAWTDPAISLRSD